MKMIFIILIMLFSFLLSFGTLDPFLPNESPIKSIDLIFTLFSFLFITLRVKRFIFELCSLNFILLFLIILSFTSAQIFYGYSELFKPLFNFKILLCTVFFIILSFYFSENKKLVHWSLLVFSISSFIYSIVVLLISPDLYKIIKGQMIVLDENPNSTSSRIAISIIYLLNFCLHNPLQWSRKRFILLLFIPSLVTMVVLSGSRGSLLAMLLGSYLVFIFSNTSKKFKVILSGLSLVISIYLFRFLLNSDDLGSRWQSALDGDTAGRTDIWQAVFQITADYPFGVGESGYVENMIRVYGLYIDTHNILLYIFVCGGIFALVCFLLFSVRLFLNGLNSYLQEKDILPIVLFSIIFFIALKTGGVITFLLLWYIFAVVGSYGRKCGER